MSRRRAVTRDLLFAWAGGRSRSRGLPPPVIDGDAVRVDTGLPGEDRRFIFAAVRPAITAVAARIDRPGILIKLCAPLPELLALLPAGWRGHPQAFLMALDGAMHPGARSLPATYSLSIGGDGPVHVVHVIASDGSLAARGRAVGNAGVFVFDQIVTEPAHRRRGLGGHVMRSLAACNTAGDRPVLTATAAGHALYTALGWQTLCFYSTAEREPAAR